ncbi:MAG: ribosome biogenesis protein WDR12 [Monoraphidium minutum]|nr:MAG: ribosome biogenesis protein WDR12 [Monoraphidium minutum]
MSKNTMAAAEDSSQVLVRFFTKLPDELRVPETEVAVPTSLKRYGLSLIINHLLALDPARPFDFLIDGELLRKTLAQHLLDHGISPESLLRVEYVPAVVPPEAKQALPHDDWVSAVSGCSTSDRLASGSYDGGVRVWDRQGNCLGSCAAHTGGVTAAAWLPAAQGSLLLTAGKDAAVRLWRVPAAGAAGGRGSRSKAVAAAAAEASPSLLSACVGHSDTVAALAVNRAGDMAATGGWDGKLLLWQTGSAAAAAAEEAGGGDGGGAGTGAKKRRVGGGDAAGVPSAPHQQEPSGGLEGHVHCVSALCWAGGGALLASGGWDHSVRLWDAASGRAVATYHGSKAVYAVAAAPGGGGGVVVFGGADSAVRVWDSRARGEALSVKGYAAGDAWLAALAWRPEGGGDGCEHHVAGVSHDGSMRLWDLRTQVPLGSVRQHADKALAVGWWGPTTIASGGADCKLQLYELPAAEA